MRSIDIDAGWSRGELMRFMRIAVVAGLVAWLFAGGPAYSADTVTTNNPPVTPGETAAQCFADATEHLRHGEWFERAATQLKEAVRQDPKNSDYHLALGCAYADRAASLGYAEKYAAQYERDKAASTQSLADWQQAQTDPKSDDYGKPQPRSLSPFTPYTKDDDKPFTLTKDLASAQITQLGHLALSEWKEAALLARNSAGRAKAEYVEGWGIELLSEYRVLSAANAGPDDGPAPLPGYPEAKDAISPFRAAVQDSPKAAIYWESLGDSLSNGLMNQADVQTKEGVADLRKSLSLSPRNSALWFRFYMAERNRDKTQAQSDLKQAALAEPDNALPNYLLAYIDFQETQYRNNAQDASSDDLHNKYPNLSDSDAKQRWSQDLATSLTDADKNLAEDALQNIEQGNQAPTCYCPTYYAPVPQWLSAWSYLYVGWAEFFMMYADLREMARDMTGYIEVAAINGDLPDGLRAGRDAVSMGMKMMGNWSMLERGRGDGTVLTELVGSAITAIAYHSMIQAVQKYGDPAMAQMIQSEYDDYRAQETVWQNLLRQQIPGQIYTNY